MKTFLIETAVSGYNYLDDASLCLPDTWEPTVLRVRLLRRHLGEPVTDYLLEDSWLDSQRLRAFLVRVTCTIALVPARVRVRLRPHLARGGATVGGGRPQRRAPRGGRPQRARQAARRAGCGRASQALLQRQRSKVQGYMYQGPRSKVQGTEVPVLGRSKKSRGPILGFMKFYSPGGAVRVRPNHILPVPHLHAAPLLPATCDAAAGRNGAGHHAPWDRSRPAAPHF
eukprot:SAG25_NODE_970_length_4484_cov_3.700114_2_plen_227_part_00